MSRLIFSPVVHLMAQTSFNPGAIPDWASDHGLLDILNDPETPLNKVQQNILSGDENDIDLIPEFAGRFCYASWAKGRSTSDYIDNILESKHGSVFEHANISFAISGVSRSLTHEWVRHRAGTGISQESQRYVDAKDMRFVVPPAVVPLLEADEDYEKGWEAFCELEVERYKELQEKLHDKLKHKYSGFKLKKVVNESARSVLPNCAETKMFWTGNVRALRHIFEVRGSLHADAEVRRLVLKMFYHVNTMHVFSDIEVKIDEEFGERHLVIGNSKV